MEPLRATAVGHMLPAMFAPTMSQFPARGNMDRFRSPTGQQMMASPMMAPVQPRLPGHGVPFLPPPFQAMPRPPVEPGQFHLPQAPFPAVIFSQQDLDMVLFGYARTKVTKESSGHALSGLRIGELSYGIDRILGSGTPTIHPSLKSAVTATIDTASLDLPEGIDIFQTSFAGAVHYGVVCKKATIPKGTKFGPFLGKVVNTSEIKSHDDNTFMWEIFKDGKLSHFVDGRGSSGNWMAYVNCARFAQEQNLIALQMDGEIYYEACKDIPRGSELLVWYGDAYLQFMGIPVSLKEVADDAPPEVESGEGYTCERCGKVFAYKYYRDKHLKYTRCVDQGDRKFPCHLCNRSFEKRDRLRIHILHVHEKHRPHKCSVCGKSFSQSSSLNKHMRVHSGERPYKCVYCNKAFTASSILRTHIRQHSGEKPFKCKHCGKAFASHAAHDSHVRRTHTKERSSVCTLCGKAFAQAQELQFHLRVHHDNGLPEDTKSLLQAATGLDCHPINDEWISPEKRETLAAGCDISGSSDSSISFHMGSPALLPGVPKPFLDDPIDVVG